MADYFLSVFIQEDVSCTPNMNSDTLPNISHIQIQVEGVIKNLHSIQAHKASRPDNLLARFLKEVANEIAAVLINIFHDSLDQGFLPAVWETAAVVHIFKKGK